MGNIQASLEAERSRSRPLTVDGGRRTGAGSAHAFRCQQCRGGKQARGRLPLLLLLVVGGASRRGGRRWRQQQRHIHRVHAVAVVVGVQVAHVDTPTAAARCACDVCVGGVGEQSQRGRARRQRAGEARRRPPCGMWQGPPAVELCQLHDAMLAQRRPIARPVRAAGRRACLHVDWQKESACRAGLCFNWLQTSDFAEVTASEMN